MYVNINYINTYNKNNQCLNSHPSTDNQIYTLLTVDTVAICTVKLYIISNKIDTHEKHVFTSRVNFILIFSIPISYY